MSHRCFLVPILSLLVTTRLSAEPVDFDRQIRPILSNACFQCHGPDEAVREADLRLDQREGLFGDLGGYSVVVPGDLKASELIARITSEDDDLKMPPIDLGKSLTDEQIDLLKSWVRDGAPWSEHWSFVPPKRPAVPEIENTQAVNNEIDNFVLARLAETRLKPSKAAPPYEQVRRVALGLTGLPPSPEIVSAFTTDPSDDAYEALVDELLASPAFGEHWAAMWLDLARYADTAGYAEDRDRTIWPWRDWVIEAFNSNLPFDEFTLLQVAGDLLPHASDDQRLATAFHRNTLNNTEGGTKDEEFRVVAVKDRLNTTLNVWMGLTVRCAECHSHKYDPISQEEYYALLDFFNQTADADRLDEEPLLELDSDYAADSPAPAAENIDKGGIKVPVLLELSDSEQRQTRVMLKGNYLALGEKVTSSTPEALHDFPRQLPRNRLGLAHWLTSSDNPLTSRVAVNRYWARLFGTGLVETEEDFGNQGALPTHPELLDWLAVEFQENGWNTKALLKKLVTSATYRQSSSATPEHFCQDPRNLYLARGPRFRMTAEMLRDQALAVSGLLSNKIYGPPVYPANPIREVTPAFRPTQKWEESEGEDRYRRSIYTFMRRSLAHPLFETFDMATREVCSLRRFRTNTPLQALMTLNDPEFVEAAQQLARNMHDANPDDLERQIAYGLETALIQPAESAQIAALQELYHESLAYFEKNVAAAEEVAGSVRFNEPSNNETAVFAGLTMVANALLNCDRFMNQ